MDTIELAVPTLAISSAQEFSPPVALAPPASSTATRTHPSNPTKARFRDKKYARYLARHGDAETIIWAQQRSEARTMRRLETATVRAFCSKREMKRARRARMKIVGSVQTFPSLEFPQEQQAQILRTSRDKEDDAAAIFEECSQMVLFDSEFPGKIIVQGRVEAIKQALAEHNENSTLSSENGRHSYHVDAAISTGDDLSGIGVAYKSCPRYWASDWTAKGYCIRAEMEVDDAEARAVWQALTLVGDNTRPNSPVEKLSDPCSLAVIYSDSQSVLQSLWVKKKGRSVAEINIISRAHELMQLGIQVELHWVPGHREVPGNYLADTVSQRALWCSLPKGKAFCYDD